MYQSELDSDIQFLPGVGPKRALLIKSELGINTISDLIHFYPFRYIDRSSIQEIAEIQPDMAFVQIQAKVLSLKKQPKKLSVIVGDDSGELELVFFRGIKYTVDRLVIGQTFLFFGKPSRFNGKINIVHPEIDNPKAPGGVSCRQFDNDRNLQFHRQTEECRDYGQSDEQIDVSRFGEDFA